MAYSIQNLKNDLTAVLHNTQLNQIVNIDGLIDRAARQLLLDCDPQETKRTLEFTTPIYNSVYNYALAPDVKGNKIIDIRPQVKRLPRDVWTQAYNQAFDIWKQNIYGNRDMFTINFNTGVKTILVSAPLLNPSIILNQADSILDNGTWVVGGTASNLVVNNTNFVQGGGSLQFDITTGTGWLENSTMTAVDLTNHLNQSSLFEWISIPTSANLISVTLRWGSDASNYYTKTLTLNQQGTAFVDGWNLIQNIWSDATVVGSPDAMAIDYLRVSFVVTANMAGLLINDINSILGSVLEYEYYSKYLFRDAITGAFQETVTDDSNLINLDTESYNLLFNFVAYLATQQQQGVDALSYDGNFFGQQYQINLQRYKAQYKSEVQKPQSTYYSMPRLNYRRNFYRN